tara:strand:+ start:20 stop:556 length:537 start_codon:yes stop_codon:yes gene_type:complete
MLYVFEKICLSFAIILLIVSMVTHDWCIQTTKDRGVTYKTEFGLSKVCDKNSKECKKYDSLDDDNDNVKSAAKTCQALAFLAFLCLIASLSCTFAECTAKWLAPTLGVFGSLLLVACLGEFATKIKGDKKLNPDNSRYMPGSITMEYGFSFGLATSATVLAFVASVANFVENHSVDRN